LIVWVRALDCGKGAAQRDRAADAEIDGIGPVAGYYGAVSAGGIALSSVGVIDRFAQAAKPVTRRALVAQGVDGYCITIIATSRNFAISPDPAK
jgi:hypothetical protein